MKKYIVEIQFENERHCLNCPLRDKETDCCNVQIDERGFYIVTLEGWKGQMKNCPLFEKD